MKRNRWIGIGTALFLALVTVSSIYAREKEAPKTAQDAPSNLMQQKLEHAQQLLSALALADFGEMIAHSRELHRISMEARWSELPSPHYAAFGDDFRNALDRIVESAEQRNIEGAALNYVQAVLTCVQCHDVVREGEDVARAPTSKDDIFNLLRGNSL